MSKKVVIRLSGGLGNQMFQYAFAYQFAKKNNATLYIDQHIFYYKKKAKYTNRNYELSVFGIQNKNFINPFKLNLKTNILFYKLIFFLKILIYSYKIEHEINPNRLINKNTYLIGYFQNYQYYNKLVIKRIKRKIKI